MFSIISNGFRTECLISILENNCPFVPSICLSPKTDQLVFHTFSHGAIMVNIYLLFQDLADSVCCTYLFFIKQAQILFRPTAMSSLHSIRSGNEQQQQQETSPDTGETNGPYNKLVELVELFKLGKGSIKNISVEKVHSGQKPPPPPPR